MKEIPYQYFSADSTTTVLSGAERRASWYLDGVTEANEPAIAENRKILRVVVEIIV
jgi:hypothetical protein